MEDKIPQEEVLEEIPQTTIKTKKPVNRKVILVLLGLVIALGLALTYVSYLLNNSRTFIVENTPISEVVAPGSPESQGISEDPTANWKTYTNEGYGFEFKYPATFHVREDLGPNFVMGLSRPAGMTKEAPFPILRLRHIVLSKSSTYQKTLIDDVIYDGSGLHPQMMI
ncbi:hypothetical protein CO058_03720 [candidate division WWE3 bacterium CG_4_9_14_0_2_um_filter_35_11]|uniref:Uncharacterized protein n=1 Tax=candidate division WWE3 bacterium CG_4_9_14_0_2_um_filter_35_11 TaxID=1975077 RepID=A0A2M8EKZ5_UNCKA|nr:MAG: hypothetical protein COV25_02420 [candidate division WWE3 bacterium CG10_big_fil_rev_8_21_14_0_10_35_32]PJC23411.1 MAG: hypothetical protein CO058_03720 [candidate division WWE3 bacterium CG_4_9_14_0_2_um_filter_35_11]